MNIAITAITDIGTKIITFQPLPTLLFGGCESHLGHVELHCPALTGAPQAGQKSVFQVSEIAMSRVNMKINPVSKIENQVNINVERVLIMINNT
jgi:hypothetical protein